MRYSHDYKKLKENRYTTIRRYKKGKVGDKVLEEYPSGRHFSIIYQIKRMTINEMPLNLIQKDGDVKTRHEFINLLNSFYRTPIDFLNEKIYVYFLDRCSV